MRAVLFGPEASVRDQVARLVSGRPNIRILETDIRDADGVAAVFRDAGAVELVIHTAAQPSHDWAATNPLVDFAINASGTLNLLEAARAHSPNATFIYTST